MKISESIAKLQEILQAKGDLEVIALTDVDETFIADFDLIFEAIELPNDIGDGFETVCALMEHPDNERENDRYYSKLELVKHKE